MKAKMIDTKTNITAISINGKQYDVIERTIGSERKFAEMKEDKSLSAIDVWVKSLEMLIGVEAFNEIFPDLDSTNATLLERVFLGAVEAYNSDYTADKAKRTAEQANQIKTTVTPLIAPVKDMINAHKVMESVKNGESK